MYVPCCFDDMLVGTANHFLLHTCMYNYVLWDCMDNLILKISIDAKAPLLETSIEVDKGMELFTFYKTYITSTRRVPRGVAKRSKRFTCVQERAYVATAIPLLSLDHPSKRYVGGSLLSIYFFLLLGV